MAETIKYKPQRDITADEITLIMSEIERSESHVNREWYDAHPEVQRHFVIEDI